MKSFINFSEDLEDRKLQLLQKQKVMKQLEREKSDRSNRQFAKDMEDKQSRLQSDQEKEEEREKLKQEIKREVKKELEDERVDEQISFSNFVEETQSCPPGKYYCHDMKKCKPIPKGYHVGRGGWLKPDPEEQNKNGKNGNGHANGHGNSSNGNGNGGNNGGNSGGNGSNGGGVSESFVNLPLTVETPRTQIEFDMGLMFREDLEENTGMLFSFIESGEKFFHMKDTIIPLDIAFINERGIIESIKELKPLSTVPISSDSSVLYALEVNRGWFATNDVNVGDKILNL